MLKSIAGGLFIMLLLSCGGKSVKKTRVELVGSKDGQQIIFDRDSIKIYFGKKELVEHSKKSTKIYAYEKKSYTITTSKGDTTVSFGWKKAEIIVFKGDTINVEERAFQNYWNKTKDTALKVTVSMDTVFDQDTHLLRYLETLNNASVTQNFSLSSQ